MTKIVCVPGYQIVEKIHASSRTLIYRGIRESDLYPVTIELIRNPVPTSKALMQIRHKYDIGKDLDLPHIIKTLALEPYQNSYALILEDCDSISLESYLHQREALGNQLQTSITFLQIAIQIAQALEGLYVQRVIHKDIKPANILIHPATQQIKLIDFSLASRLPKENQEIKNANMLVGTLAYMSPEQTGRMNRGIDYRSDFYALGVTCYEILTGQLPFISDDPMELVHCHLAQQPVPVRHIKPNTPLMISEIVSKLMAKNAEDRYQNPLGLKHDLEICLTQLQTTGKIGLFVLGENDPSDRFLIPEKLYGREPEVATLLNAFERVSKGMTEILLVAGGSGIGKTLVIQEIHKPIVRQRGYFIKGKYDQFQRNIPFSAFVQAFRDLMGQLLSESDAQLQTWKTQILAAVGENGQVLIDVIPELERIIGQQLPAIELSGSAAQQRFNLLFQKFVRLFTTAAHPLVLFLDDLQWADLASLNLLQSLMYDAGYLLVLGAYRDNEVSPIHPAILAIDQIEKTGIPVNTITLKPLSLEDLNELVADTLHCDLRLAEPLTELIDVKTQGNPFFAAQFLKTLYEDGLITFVRSSQHESVGGWICDLTQIKSLVVTNDVVKFMALQLERLPIGTQWAITCAACIGSEFDLHTLAIVLEQSPERTASELWSGLEANLLIPMTETYNFFTQSTIGQSPHFVNESVPSTTANPVYRFLHDRVQQAAYSLIPDDQKQLAHLKIGNLLYQNSSKIVRTERLFDIVGQLNLAKELVIDPIDRQRIVDLNFKAGNKARNSTAYTAANVYFQTGIEILGLNCWEMQYQLTLDLHVAAAEAAYLAGNIEQMEEIAAVVLRSTRTILDKVEIYRIQIAALTANGKMIEAISIGRLVLSQLGLEVPHTYDRATTANAFQALAYQLQDRRIEELSELPVMNDRQAYLSMKLLADLGAPIFFAIPELSPILSCMMVRLSLKFGNTLLSGLGYVNHGVVLTAFFGDLETGYNFGKLALDLTNRSDSEEFKGRISFLFATWLQHRREFVRRVIPTLRYAYRVCIEAGFFTASYSISCYFDANLICGIELNKWELEISPYSKELERIKQYSIQAYLEMKRQVAQNLMSRNSQPDYLIGSAYDETVMIPRHLQDRDLTGLAYAYIYKLMLAYLFDNYAAALEYIAKGELYLQAVSGMIPIPVFHLYAALTHLAVFTNQSGQNRLETLAQVDIHQATIDLWAKDAPMNYLHKWHLIEAEKQRILGNKAGAIEHYDLAISGAKEHQFIHEEALANELAAKFYLSWGKEKIAQSYLAEAYYCYGRWGANAKVDHLLSLYPQLLAAILQADPVEPDVTERTDLSSSLMSDCTFLDLAALLKASRTISEEIRLDRTICNLIDLVTINAGADKCVLLLEQNSNLQVVARVELGQHPQLLSPISFNLSNDVAISLINKVKHNLEPVLLINPIESPEFNGDPYLRQNQPKSVLCSPILNQGELIGILYLENQLIASAFTRERIETLQVLVAQAAISIENAKLYTELQISFTSLERKVEERTLELKTAKELAESAERTKTNFFNNMTHELRTPLNAILGMSEGLTEEAYGVLNQRQHRCVEVIASSGNHLLSLIDDILDLAKLEAGKLELYCELTQIRQLCAASIVLVEQQALKKQIQIEVKIPDNLPDLMVDERRIRQVLINLLTNAVKFTPEHGRISLEVAHISGEDHTWIQIAVSDTGIGIEPEHLDLLFQPFVQIDSALSRTAQGTGLGLNLVREFVELHGGRVNVSSKINVGSRFTVDLPLGNLPFIIPLTKDKSSCGFI
jgi:predicted ATPase/signal transduction histidine kinase